MAIPSRARLEKCWLLLLGLVGHHTSYWVSITGSGQYKLLLVLFLLLSLLTVVQVGFGQSIYLVNEAQGSVAVCVVIFGATLDRNVTVLLSTQNGTAICEFVFVLKLLSYQWAKVYFTDWFYLITPHYKYLWAQLNKWKTRIWLDLDTETNRNGLNIKAYKNSSIALGNDHLRSFTVVSFSSPIAWEQS